MQQVTSTLRESNPTAYDAAMSSVCAGLMHGQESAGHKGHLAILLFPVIQKLVGEKAAAQVTGDLVELPLEQVVGVMRDDRQLRICVDQASKKVQGAAVESDSEQEGAATADESVAASEPEREAPTQPMNWQSILNAIADPASKTARRVVKRVEKVEEEKRIVRSKPF